MIHRLYVCVCAHRSFLAGLAKGGGAAKEDSTSSEVRAAISIVMSGFLAVWTRSVCQRVARIILLYCTGCRQAVLYLRERMGSRLAESNEVTHTRASPRLLVSYICAFCVQSKLLPYVCYSTYVCCLPAVSSGLWARCVPAFQSPRIRGEVRVAVVPSLGSLVQFSPCTTFPHCTTAVHMILRDGARDYS